MRNPEVGGAGHGVHRPNAGQQGFGKAMTAQDDTSTPVSQTKPSKSVDNSNLPLFLLIVGILLFIIIVIWLYS